MARGCIYAVGSLVLFLLVLLAVGSYLIQLPQNGGPSNGPSQGFLLIALVVAGVLIYALRRK